MTTPDAKRIADRYIGRDGGEPAIEPQPSKTLAEAAWREHAETVRSVLRRKSIAKTEDGRIALFGFEEIGRAIAEGEKRGKK